MTAHSLNDADYLKQEQYNSSNNLGARIRLHEQFSTSKADLHRWIFDQLLEVASADAKILEVGCGRGDLWKKNAERVPAGWKITLTDFSDGMLADCKAHLGEASSAKFGWDVCDVQDLPFMTDSFDVVIANYMLYHVPDRQQAITELRRVLKSSGTLLAMTNGTNHLKELYELAIVYDHTGELARDWLSDSTRSHNPFTLENGEAQLRESFDQVRKIPFEDQLRITKVQPLLDYIASMIRLPGQSILSEHGETLTRDLEARITQDGVIVIQKATGLFVAD